MRLAALALLGVALAGCARPAIDFAALPETPIAFVYRNVEETERILDEAESAAAAQRTPAEDELNLELDTLGKYAGLRSDADVARDQQGRIALLVPSSAQLDTPSPLPRGARPLGWSPDRQRLLYSATLRDGIHLFEWDLPSDEVRQLTTPPGSQFDGCYGPGGVLAWAQAEQTGPNRGTRIFVRRPGEPPRAVTPGPSDLQPACAPDGTRLVYTSRDAAGAVTLRWVDPASGAGGSLGPGRSASFSPDGRWIVYSARSAAGWRLRRMNADGSGKRSLGRSGFEESDPAVSPDGRWVVFAASQSAATPVSRLFVRSADGEVDRQLEFSGSGLLPIW